MFSFYEECLKTQDSAEVLLGVCSPFLCWISHVLRKHRSSMLWKDLHICSKTKLLKSPYHLPLWTLVCFRVVCIIILLNLWFTLRTCLLWKQLIQVFILLKVDLSTAKLYPAIIVPFKTLDPRGMSSNQGHWNNVKKNKKTVYFVLLLHIFLILC